jgi:hypothetical protein
MVLLNKGVVHFVVASADMRIGARQTLGLGDFHGRRRVPKSNLAGHVKPEGAMVFARAVAESEVSSSLKLHCGRREDAIHWSILMVARESSGGSQLGIER